MRIKPAGHRVLVKPDPLEEKTKNGIILAHDNKERKEAAQATGTILAIGPTAWKDFSDGTPWAEVGDRIWFARHGGALIEDPDSGEKYRLLNDEEIAAVMETE